MQSDTLDISCPAKLNLALSVGAPRDEDGLHPICSWMVLINFCDRLTLRKSDGGISSFDIDWEGDAPLPQQMDWPIESDLAYRAHQMMEQHVGRSLPVEAVLKKRIPTGAGLGGGSGNAAGMLTGLNDLFELELSEGELAELGVRLGADVCFMLMHHAGVQSAVMSGIGECPEMMERDRAMHFVLVLPGLPCPTAAVYQAFDRIAERPGADAQRVLTLAETDPLPADELFNDLTPAAFELRPGLRALRDQINAAVGLPVHLSGSGSAMFVLVNDREAGQATAETIRQKTGATAILVATPPGVDRR